jgi:peptide/nickel transport system permease protein
MGFASYLLRRLLLLIPVVLGATIVVFAVVHVIPGDPAWSALGFWAGKTQVEEWRKLMRLDEPIHMQYVHWLGDLLRGDLGKSFFTYRPVAEELARRAPITAELSIVALAIGMVVGIPAGMISAVRRDSAYDKMSRFVAVAGFSVPEYFLGMMLILVFAVFLRVLPPGGFATLQESPADNLQFLILPALALGLPIAAVYSRFTRSGMLEILDQDYIRTARAKGLTERLVIYRHALKNALIPIVTIIGMNIGYLMSGAVLIETIFGWPGMGAYLYSGILSRDYPIIQGTVLVIAIVFVLSNLGVDLAYAFLDPRIRFGRE